MSKKGLQERELLRQIVKNKSRNIINRKSIAKQRPDDKLKNRKVDVNEESVISRMTQSRRGSEVDEAPHHT